MWGSRIRWTRAVWPEFVAHAKTLGRPSGRPLTICTIPFFIRLALKFERKPSLRQWPPGTACIGQKHYEIAEEQRRENQWEIIGKKRLDFGWSQQSSFFS